MTTAAAAAPAPAMAATPLSHHRQTRLAAAYPASAAASPWHRPGRAYLNLSAAAIRSPATSRHRHSPARAAAPSAPTPSASTFHGPCYVVGNNIDTDQIIPAQYLTLVPSKPDEYRKLGSYALIGLPSAAYPAPFVEHGHETTRFPIIIAGANFGCGSSREHAPVALGAAGVRAVVAESYARIFFRNSVATGEVYPVESEGVGLCGGGALRAGRRPLLPVGPGGLPHEPQQEHLPVQDGPLRPQLAVRRRGQRRRGVRGGVDAAEGAEEDTQDAPQGPGRPIPARRLLPEPGRLVLAEHAGCWAGHLRLSMVCFHQQGTLNRSQVS